MNSQQPPCRLCKGVLFETILLLLSVAFTVCICRFHSLVVLDGEDGFLAVAQQIIQPVAEHYFKMEDPTVLFFYTKGDDISESLCDFVGLPDCDNQLVILDIPNQMYYTYTNSDLTREGVEKFVTDFVNGKLEGNKVQK